MLVVGKDRSNTIVENYSIFKQCPAYRPLINRLKIGLRCFSDLDALINYLLRTVDIRSNIHPLSEYEEMKQLLVRKLVKLLPNYYPCFYLW